jgi:hypothetical protein
MERAATLPSVLSPSRHVAIRQEDGGGGCFGRAAVPRRAERTGSRRYPRAPEMGSWEEGSLARPPPLVNARDAPPSWKCDGGCQPATCPAVSSPQYLTCEPEASIHPRVAPGKKESTPDLGRPFGRRARTMRGQRWWTNRAGCDLGQASCRLTKTPHPERTGGAVQGPIPFASSPSFQIDTSIHEWFSGDGTMLIGGRFEQATRSIASRRWRCWL